MIAYLLNRMVNSLLVLFIVCTAVFVFIHLAPGGPSILMSDELSKEQIEQIRKSLGLDDPIYIQYIRWMNNVLHGDLGISFISARSVLVMILERIPATILLGASALIFSVGVALPLGSLSALRQGGILDRIASFMAFFGVSMPVFWFGLMLILFFSVKLGWLPSAGMYTVGKESDLLSRLLHLIMPTIVLGLSNAAELTRYARSSMLEVLRQDYVRTARSKGLGEWMIIFKHALKNAMVTNISVIGLSLSRLIGGAAITEFIFAWPGMGRLAITSALGRDYPVVMGITMVVAVVVILSNLLVDLLYPLFDPRIQLIKKAV